jgi:dipeptidyl aminopeptidase/acylaminoacyl peptidase
MKISVPAFLALCLLLVACGGAQSGEPTTPPAPSKSTTYSMEQLLASVSIGSGSFSADESKLLVHTNETGVFNVYSLDRATTKRTPITEGETTTFAVAYFPEDDRLIFTHDSDGNEIYHLFLREEEGAVRELTEGEETRETFAGFSHDLTKFFTVNNRRDRRFMDLYEWDVRTLESRLVYQNDDGLDPSLISANRRWLALSKSNTTNDRDMYLLDLEAEDAEPVLLSEHEGEAVFDAQDFTADSRHLYYTTNVDTEFTVLMRYDLETQAREEVFRTDWDVTAMYFSRDDTYRVIATNEDGTTRLRITRTATGEEVVIPDMPEGEVTGLGFSRSERFMRFFVSSDTQPRNLYVFDFETNELQQLTDTMNPEVDADDLVTSEVIRFEARDGMTIPGPLYRPRGASAQNKVPALIWVHGGPGGQSTAGWSAERQYLLNHGYAIFAVNNRGSSGYGKSFRAADDRRHGREPLWDCVDAKEHLKTLDWVDPDRIGILGGSYGGYMVLAALAYEPEEFVVGVDIFGVANWVRTLESIPPYWESFREALYREMGHPERDAQMLREISPVFHGDRIRRPLIILQGANDPRVLQAESDDMVAAIREHGGTVEYVVFDDEGHGFTKNANRVRGWDAILSFLDTHLR